MTFHTSLDRDFLSRVISISYCSKRQILAQHYCMVAAVKGSRLQLNNKIKATANYDEIRSEDKDETKSMSLSE